MMVNRPIARASTALWALAMLSWLPAAAQDAPQTAAPDQTVAQAGSGPDGNHDMRGPGPDGDHGMRGPGPDGGHGMHGPGPWGGHGMRGPGPWGRPDGRGPGPRFGQFGEGHGPDGGHGWHHHGGPLGELAKAEADQAASQTIAALSHAQLADVQRIVRTWGPHTALRYFDVDDRAFHEAFKKQLSDSVNAAAKAGLIADSEARHIVEHMQHEPPPPPPPGDAGPQGGPQEPPPPAPPGQ